MIENFILWRDSPGKNFFQCRSNFLLNLCGSYVFSFLIQNDCFTSRRITSPLTRSMSMTLYFSTVWLLLQKWFATGCSVFLSEFTKTLWAFDGKMCASLTDVNICITFCTKDTIYYTSCFTVDITMNVVDFPLIVLKFWRLY